MKFKLWLENDKNKILILVHPDCAYELGLEAAEQYAQKLTSLTKNFNYVITHSFASNEDWIKHSHMTEEYKQAFSKVYQAAKSVSDKFLYNSKDIYGCSYSTELPDYLIENPHSDIYMAGGYEGNCLWISYKNLFEKLGWLMKENGNQVFYYKPLIFTDRMGGGLNRTRDYGQGDFKDYQKTYGNFHPNKVNYKEWLKIKEMGGAVDAIVTKKDCNNPDFQVQGALCQKKKKRVK